ncbi:MAG: hypothetical protein CVU59_09285 [Deltaproteobacteria bacterium HGW-Deltaproteobacteria-17]|nr:MAG: hypothetical protein CVU59_09285 [Deltaproteobacteria bacterium HGW-Deltaproteobacteria-17]
MQSWPREKTRQPPEEPQAWTSLLTQVDSPKAHSSLQLGTQEAVWARSSTVQVAAVSEQLTVLPHVGQGSPAMQVCTTFSAHCW